MDPFLKLKKQPPQAVFVFTKRSFSFRVSLLISASRLRASAKVKPSSQKTNFTGRRERVYLAPEAGVL